MASLTGHMFSGIGKSLKQAAVMIHQGNLEALRQQSIENRWKRTEAAEQGRHDDIMALRKSESASVDKYRKDSITRQNAATKSLDKYRVDSLTESKAATKSLDEFRKGSLLQRKHEWDNPHPTKGSLNIPGLTGFDTSATKLITEYEKALADLDTNKRLMSEEDFLAQEKILGEHYGGLLMHLKRGNPHLIQFSRWRSVFADLSEFTAGSEGENTEDEFLEKETGLLDYLSKPFHDSDHPANDVIEPYDINDPFSIPTNKRKK